jgi:hypothetical protein
MDNRNILESWEEQRSPASFQRQNAAGCIDAALTLGVFFFVSQFFPFHFMTYPSFPLQNELIVFVLFILYRFSFLVLLDSTLGMSLAGILLLDHEQKPLSAGAKALAAVFVLYRGVEYYKRDITLSPRS